MFGVGAYLIKMLCEESMYNGGAGYSFAEIGQMTPDQAWFRVCDKEVFRDRQNGRVRKISPAQAASLVNESGMLKVRTADGQVVQVPYGRRSQ